MEKMKKLYERVAADNELQAKFNAIIIDAENAGEAATREKLAAFAKEVGFDVKLDEMQDFFKKLAERIEGELSDAELDIVAGGKLTFTWEENNTTGSIATLGMGCTVSSAELAPRKSARCF